MCLSDVLLLLLFLPVGGTGWAGTATLQLDDTDQVVYKQILRFGMSLSVRGWWCQNI